MMSDCIMRLAVIVSSKLRCDISDDVVLSWCFHWVFMLLEPGVLSCWVGITAAAQSHWTALLYFTRGTWWQKCVFRPIWRHIETCNNSIYIHDSINDIRNHIVAKFGFIINANTVKTILYCVLLTFNINSVVDISFPYRILSLTAILSRVWRHDVAKDE